MIHNVNGNITDDSFLLQYISFNNFHLSRYSFSLSSHLLPSYILLCYFCQPAYLSFPLPIFSPIFHFIFDLSFHQFVSSFYHPLSFPSFTYVLSNLSFRCLLIFSFNFCSSTLFTILSFGLKVNITT